MARPDELEAWIAAEYRTAAARMLRSVSATSLLHRRPAFGTETRPVAGSVVASPVSGAYDPEPDYFFHWYRDAAVVAGAVSALIADGTLVADGPKIIADMVRFALGLDGLDGRDIAARPDFEAGVAESARQHLRPREELAAVHGDRVRMEARVNPDGSLDRLRWARPQYDGPALRALACLRHGAGFGADDAMTRLILADLDFTWRHRGAEGFDIWEERAGADYYTRLLHQAALAAGARFLAGRGEAARAADYREASDALLDALDGHWSAERTAYRSLAGAGAAGERDVDFAVILAVLHAGRESGRHSIGDPRVHSTFASLEAVFAADYAINRAAREEAPAMGRYRGDTYQSGGAFFFATLGAAEFHYRLARAVAGGAEIEEAESRAFLENAGVEERAPAAESAAALVARGDMFLATVRRFTPASGEMAEQFDQTNGRQSSARDLAWSYAAFITAIAARRAALGAPA